jgi:hypothetical protein
VTIDYSIGSRGQLKVDSSVKALRLALSEYLLKKAIVGNASIGLSQSAAWCTRHWMKFLLQQQARCPLDHIMSANIQNKLDIIDEKLESITMRYTVCCLTRQTTRNWENVVDELLKLKENLSLSTLNLFVR